MILLGAAWSDGLRVRSFRKKLSFSAESPRALFERLQSVPGMPEGDFSDFKRGSLRTRQTLLAAMTAIADSGHRPGPDCSVPGFGFQGCFQDNKAYFQDYCDSGRSSARGSLFVSTVVSTPLAECAIAFGLHGEVFYLEHASRTWIPSGENLLVQFHKSAVSVLFLTGAC